MDKILLEEMKKSAKTGKVEMNYSDMAKRIGCSTGLFYKLINKLETEGKIKLLRKTKKGNKHTFVPALYKIIQTRRKVGDDFQATLLRMLTSEAKEGKIKVNTLQIAKETGYSRSTILRNLDKLQNAGVIKPLKVARCQPAIYEICSPVSCAKVKPTVKETLTVTGDKMKKMFTDLGQMVGTLEKHDARQVEKIISLERIIDILKKDNGNKQLQIQTLEKTMKEDKMLIMGLEDAIKSLELKIQEQGKTIQEQAKSITSMRKQSLLFLNKAEQLKKNLSAIL